jgi:group I intron endonuclease
MIHNYHYIYKTTNNITGKFYIGMHSTNKLNDNYLGSGVHLNRSLKKYGKQNHNLTILEFAESRELVSVKEAAIVNDALLKDPLCMNLKCGGIGGYGMKHSNESKLKISIAKKGNSPSSLGRRLSNEAKAKISKSWENRCVSTATKLRQAEAHRGIMHTYETRVKISTSRNSKMPIHNEPVIIDEVEYLSVFEASLILDLPIYTIIYRIKSESKRFKNTHYKYKNNKETFQ